MILEEQTIKSFGYSPADIGKFSKNNIVIKCDCCGTTFLKTSYKINMCRRNSRSTTDVCSNKNCINWKRNNTMLKTFGVKNAGQSIILREKVKKTCMEKFGENNPFQSTEIKKKIENILLKKYGVKNPFQSTQIKDFIKKTNLSKYGKEYSSQSDIIKQKTRKTFMEKWGGIGGASPEILEKITNTTIHRYGGFGLASPKTSIKIKKTNVNRYGSEFPTQSYIIKQRVLKTMEKLYGKHYSKTDEFKEKRKRTNVMKYGQENPILEFSRRSRGRISRFQREVYKEILLKFPDAYMEKEVTGQITSDIFIPSKNLIVECYGDYWHCNPIKYKGDFFHKNCNKFASDIWGLDQNREKEIRKNYNLNVIWEASWNKYKLNGDDDPLFIWEIKDLDEGVSAEVSKIKVS